MFSILFVLISHTPLLFLKAVSLIFYIFATTFKVSHLKITEKNIKHCFGEDKELLRKSFRETIELSLIFPYVWGKKDNYKKLIDPDYMENILPDDDRPKIFFTLNMGCVDLSLIHI